MADNQTPEAAAPVAPAQPEVMQYAVPAPMLKAAIDLIDNEIVGAKGRQIANALERSPLLMPEAIAAQTAAVEKRQAGG